VPESPIDETLQRILAYPDASDEPAADGFVVEVMARVRREQRRRRLILGAFGLVGALFGLAGATMLADGIGLVFEDVLSSTVLMQGALLVAAAAAFHTWLMGDDLPLGG
jgi:hypothetical protein